MTNQSKSKVVLVSGGSRGLGQAIVSQCLERGYAVATFSRSQTPFVQGLTSSDPQSERFLWRNVDATDPAALRAFVAEVVAKFGRLDALVNNAGVGVEGVLPTMRASEIDSGIDLNLRAPIFLVQACSKHMLMQRSGAIVNISSVNAIRGHSGVVVYSATKAALDGMTRSLARELGIKGIRVNSIAPGYFESDMVKDLSPEAKQRIVRRTPLARLGTTDDVARAVLFLLSAEASFITGQVIAVDGGITC